MKTEEQLLRDGFAALRDADAAQAPSFHQLVRAPERRHSETSPAFPRMWFAFGAAAAAAVGLVLAFQGHNEIPVDTATDEQWLAICDWTPSSDTLLVSSTSPWESPTTTDDLIDNDSDYGANSNNPNNSNL